MITIVRNQEVSKEIPSEVVTFLDDIENYIVVKDGHIIEKKITDEFSDLVIEDASNLSSEFEIYYDSESVNSIKSDSYEYNLSDTTSGLFIKTKQNKAYEQTLHVFYIQENGEFVNNVMLVADTNSELKYFEYLINQTETSVNHVVNAFALENAKVELTAVSKFNGKAVATMTRNGFVKRYGNVSFSVAEINDSITESNTNILLQEEYASGTTKTVAITNSHQEAKFVQLVEHKAKDTEGYIENYGVSNNNSTLVFEGIGKINKDMKRSVARQSNRGIVLGNDSRLDANPLLLIDEYDVEASHGAAIGKIDEEQLYYLMSRGLTLKNAERLIISGFLSPVLTKLTTDKLKEDFILTVEEKTL